MADLFALLPGKHTHFEHRINAGGLRSLKTAGDSIGEI
jgi:hypothetical protein